MATVNMYTCTAGYKNEKTEWWWRWWCWWWRSFFCSPHFLPLTCIRFLELSTIFLFSFLTTMIFLFMYRFHCWSLNILHTTIFVFIFSSFYFYLFFSFWLLLFFIIFGFIYRWKPTVIQNFRLVGRSVLHWLKQYHAEFILWWIELMMMMLYVI